MGKAPSPTPPKETAAAQTGTNISTAIANNLMGQQNTTYADGSTLTYTNEGTQTITDPYTGESYEIPISSIQQTLSPTNQAALEAQQKAGLNLSNIAEDRSGFLGQYLSGGLDLSGLPEMQSSYAGARDFSKDRRRHENALMRRMDRYLARDQENLDAKLAGQGIGIGSDAYSGAQFDLARQRNDARLGAILAAGDEQARMVGLAQQAAAFNNGARSQGLQEAFSTRAQPINEIIGLMSGSQIQMPNFNAYQPAPLPTTNVAGIIGNYDNAKMNQWMQNQASLGSAISAFGGLGGLGF